MKEGAVVAIDGKSMRGTIDKDSGNKIIHICADDGYVFSTDDYSVCYK
jgi:hypothetical protein